MFSNDILRARIDTKLVTEKMVTNLNLNFNFFIQCEVWAMGFQELCLLCYETPWLRHSQVWHVAQSLLWPPATV